MDGEWVAEAEAWLVGLQELADLFGRVGVPLLAAFALGGAIGWEREWRQKPAGLRTHMLVSLGAAAATRVTFAIYGDLTEGPDGTMADPLRIVEGVIGGIGFLGAGAILREGGSVHGLTTAGTVWLAGAVGLACGSGHYDVAVSATLLALVALVVLRWVENRILAREARETRGAGAAGAAGASVSPPADREPGSAPAAGADRSGGSTPERDEPRAGRRAEREEGES